MTVTSWVRTALNRKIVLSRGMCSRGLCPYRLWGSQGSQVAAFKILLEEKSGTMGSYSMLERFEGSRALSILQRLSSKKKVSLGFPFKKKWPCTAKCRVTGVPTDTLSCGAAGLASWMAIAESTLDHTMGTIMSGHQCNTLKSSHRWSRKTCLSLLQLQLFEKIWQVGSWCMSCKILIGLGSS